MSSSWHSLYFYCDRPDKLIESIWAGLAAEGFTRYDPFGLMPITKVYARTVKGFLAPPQNGWSRVILASDTPFPDEILTRLALPALAIDWSDQGLKARVLAQNALDPRPDALQNLLTAAQFDQLTRVWDLPDGAGSTVTKGDPALAVIPDVRGVDPRQAQKWMTEMSGKLLSAEQQAAGQQILQQQRIDWQSAGGQKIAAVLACLPIPVWREPDYVVLRDAYQLQQRRQRNPNAMLYPGDAEAIAAVPNALIYTPIFAGKAGI
ncbi:MAG: hypothetical protein MUF87_08870 [Anaerolineae bacterium]|nr:hypothetical protein [Anaerolineae bacterium]